MADLGRGGRMITLMTERPTLSSTEPHLFEAMLDNLDRLNVPDGYKAEIIRGNIVMSPRPKGLGTVGVRLSASAFWRA
jgi:hypothetical protein